ncbi:putative transcription factor interactor and regulator LIM family [Lupinus albus]|uniref:Putative transcription factor interactor and regulator LIM family n=1 Tax=Lupinus albus TaxID=3870 RepID=A0A6A4NZW6_LUPAL|nr:putative transcription factor interactor and regulator LIM family [Lupinus albus]
MSFTGTLDKCKACDKTVYVVDLLTLEGIPYHKNCFKCSHCKGYLTVWFFLRYPMLLLLFLFLFYSCFFFFYTSSNYFVILYD